MARKAELLSYHQVIQKRVDSSRSCTAIANLVQVTSSRRLPTSDPENRGCTFWPLSPRNSLWLTVVSVYVILPSFVSDFGCSLGLARSLSSCSRPQGTSLAFPATCNVAFRRRWLL